jgi:hypothetical protein
MAAYSSNRDEVVFSVIDADPVAASVRALMDDRTDWHGTASKLLAALSEVAGERTMRAREWPETPRGLSGRLRRAAPFLRRIGIEVTFARTGHEKARVIRITRAPAFSASENDGIRPSASSASSAPGGIANVFNDLARAGCGRSADGADGADAKIPTHSAPGKAAPRPAWECDL